MQFCFPLKAVLAHQGVSACVVCANRTGQRTERLVLLVASADLCM
jgi:hypothetical protein